MLDKHSTSAWDNQYMYAPLQRMWVLIYLPFMQVVDNTIMRRSVAVVVTLSKLTQETINARNPSQFPLPLTLQGAQHIL
jgi:hypothetical protein